MQTDGKEKTGMKYTALIIPIILVSLFVYAAIKKIKIYDAFTDGVKKAIPLILNIFPYVATVLMMTELFSASGLSGLLINSLSPVFSFLGIPPEITPLVLLKPFSGSGSLSVLSEILSSYGADGYIGRCASAVFGSSETIFYVSAVYYSTSTDKKLTRPIIISLASTFISTIIACLLCRFI